MKHVFVCLSIALTATLALAPQAYAADEQVTVNVDNFAKAETDMQIGRMLEGHDGVNTWGHAAAHASRQAERHPHEPRHAL